MTRPKTNPKTKMTPRRRRSVLLTGKAAWEAAFTSGRNGLVFPPHVKKTTAAKRRYEEGRRSRGPSEAKPIEPPANPLPNGMYYASIVLCPQCQERMEPNPEGDVYTCKTNPLHPKRYASPEAAVREGMRHSYYPAFVPERPLPLETASVTIGYQPQHQVSSQRVAYNAGMIGQIMPPKCNGIPDCLFFYELGQKHCSAKDRDEQLGKRWDKLVQLCEFLEGWEVANVDAGKIGIEMTIRKPDGSSTKTLLLSASSPGIIADDSGFDNGD